MLPYLLLLMFGMVVGEASDVVFQDSIHAKDNVKECVTSMMQDFVNKFESIRKADENLIKSMQTEIENLKTDNLVYRKEIDQLKYVDRKQMRQSQQLRTDSTERALGEKQGDLSPSRHVHRRFIGFPSNNSAMTPVAFHAILGHQFTDPGNDFELSFENVITNIGNSYSRNTGAFTAYQPGTYVFTWEITTTPSQYMDTHLVKNGAVVGNIRTWGYSSSGSTSSGTVVLDLDTRDEVWVKVGDHTSGADVLANYSMFSGFRLY